MTFAKKTIRDVPIDGKTVLVRADYNVPLNKDGTVRDDFRIRASLATLEYLFAHSCKVVIMSHLGRPTGREEKYSLAPVAERLAQLSGREVVFVNDCKGDRVKQVVKHTSRNAIILLENLRFYELEEQNDEEFARQIARASGAQYFVQDGFGVVHRAHASTDAITRMLPSVAGLLLEREYTTITAALEVPDRPLVALLGGAKVSDKIKIIERFLGIADRVLIGGAMANTFLAYKGYPVGKSLYEPNQQDVLDRVYNLVAQKDEHRDSELLMLPKDVAVAHEIEPTEPRRVVEVSAVTEDDIILDIGDQTAELYASIVAQAGTIIWNGPMGYSELPNFAKGSEEIANVISTHPSAESIIGGGDTADFVLSWSGDGGKNFSHISTGGGAGLDLMAGKQLPGVEALLDRR